ncbi:Down syndrome cell adhesion molecule-like protein 1 homolog isoform X5 [Oncorhynchus tshawytscha]|uniref:Down syndrome cell adhesion molecule-like protein 1 homolog isoform X5 n=1 Tax=Oncorhynchus tshawytscha TaxID=74940 RepID=UPI001C3E4E84|nr:Down syndrome cell adhesion molecule-like protein 1 homolog isoform X5 [Oncorhynchus tshawytscha]
MTVPVMGGYGRRDQISVRSSELASLGLGLERSPVSIVTTPARSLAWPNAAPRTRRDCTTFLRNIPAIYGMWLVTLFLLYSLQEVNSEDVVSTRLYFVNASLQRVTFSSSVGVSLPCPAGGAPHAVLRWYLATGDDIYDVPHIRHVHANGTLQLYPFSPSAFNSYIHDNEYFCTAENQAGKIRSPSIHVKAVFREPYTVRVADQRSMRGNVAVFKCLIPTAVQEYVSVVSWEKDTVSMVPGNRFFLTSFGALYISEVQKEDALSTYRCITKHKYSGETRQSNGARLSVMDPTESTPSVLDSFQSGEVQVGRNVELPCIASGYPNPTIRWLKDGRPLPADSRWTRRLTGLTVSDLRLDDSGNYICEVTNSFGSKEVTGHLNVIEPLRVTLSPKNLKTGISSTVILSCAVQGSPHFTLSWYRNTEPVLPDQHFSIQGAHNETLFISAAQKRHSGAYQCFATRKGQTAQDFSIILLEDGTPRIVSSFSERVVVPGEPFSLMCAAKGAPPPTITWTLDDEAVARDPSRVRASQYTLSDGSTVSHVNVSSPEIRDGGVYRCAARNSAGSAEYQARINVRGSPRIRDMRNITAVAGRNTFINCRVIGYPYYSIKWYKEGLLLPDNHRQVVYENGTLKLSDVQKVLDEGAYLCSVLIQPQIFISQTVYVQVKVPPLIQPFDFPPTSIGKLMYIACVVSSGDMPIHITWRKDGQEVAPSSGVNIETKEYMSSLQIGKVSLKHNGNYTCIASNDAATVSSERQLTVTVPPQFVVQPNNQDGIYGKVGVLNCSVDGYPPPKVMWKHAKGIGNPQQYHPVPLTGRIQIMGNGSLLIRHVLEEDRGYYLCQASNGVGSDISKSMVLTVKIPAMITSHPNTTMAIKGQIKELNCTARGEWPIIIRWERGDTVIDPDRNPRYAINTSPNEKSDEVLSTLKLKPAERGDSVFFSCHAINSYGEGRGLIQLTVQEPPDPPELEVREVKDRSMNLRWTQRFDGNSIITSYDIEYKNKTDPWELKHATRKISPTNNQANIVDLHPAQIYSIRMFSYNKIGHSQASKELTISTEEAQPDGPPVEVFLLPMTSQSIRVTWKAPRKELQNGVIRGYQIGYRENGPGSNGQYSIVEMKATGDSEVYTLDNLKKFAQYGVVVQAFNRAGTGPSSSEINATTLEDVPSQPPQNVRAISVTSDEAVITWAEPPRLTLHGVLKGYRVVFWSLFPDGEWGEMQNITTTREQVELRGLEKFTNYSVQVLAYTQAGDGVRSNVLYIQTREDHPGPPAGIKAVPSSTSSVVVSWLPPHKPNGIIRKYTIYCSSPGSGQPAPSEYEANPELLFYRVTHLNRGQQYLIWAAAVTTAGRGNISDKVTVEPAGKAPAKILSFGGTVTTPWMKEVRLPCSSVGEPTPTIKWTKDSEDTAIPVTLDGQRLIMANGTLVLRSVKAEDSGYYTCTATNTLGFDTIIVNLLVQVPPDQPRLTVSTTSSTSITLAWIPGDNGGSSIRGFVLQYSVDNIEGWRDVFISSSERSFKLDNLRCGTWYKVKLAAKNSVGAGRISEIIEAKTHGREPQFNKDHPVFTHVNSTHARLNLQGWASGGCPITAVLLEFRPKGNWAWQNVRTNATTDVFLAELREATWYELKMKACNSAGCGNQSSQFATLDYDGTGTIPPIKSARPEGDDVKKLFSIGCPVILVTLVVALLFIIRKKRKEKRLKRLRDAKSLAEMLISSKNNRSFDTPVKGPPQGPRLHIDIPRVQLLIEDKEGIKQIGEDKATIPVTDTEFSQNVNPQSFCTGVSVHHPALIQNTGPLIDMSDIRPGTNPVSRKSVKSTHSTRNRYSSQWTLTKCQSSTPARTLTSDWRTVGSQHGITVTESDSYSASLSQDTDKGRNSMVSTESASSTYEELARAYEHAKLEEHLQHAKFEITECFISDSSSDQMTTGTNDNADSMTSMSTPSETGLCRFTASPPKPQEYDRGRPTNVAVPIPHRANKSEWTGKSDYCNLPLYMKTDPFFRKQSELRDPCPVVPPREASIRSLAQRAYHTQGRHMTLDSSKQQQALTVGHAGLAGLSASGGASGGGGGVGGATGGPSGGSSTSSLPQRTLTMPGSSSSSAQSAAATTDAAAGGDSRDPLLESSSSGPGRLERQKQAAGGAYSKSYTLV